MAGEAMFEVWGGDSVPHGLGLDSRALQDVQEQTGRRMAGEAVLAVWGGGPLPHRLGQYPRLVSILQNVQWLARSSLNLPKR
jgi:hypothetical protein